MCPVGGTPLFVTLWDTDDLSACQRACACNLSREQIVYSETGNGFFKVRDEDWCFRKEPYQRSWGPHNEVEKFEIKQTALPKRHQFKIPTADEILASL